MSVIDILPLYRRDWYYSFTLHCITFRHHRFVLLPLGLKFRVEMVNDPHTGICSIHLHDSGPEEKTLYTRDRGSQ